MSPHTALLLAPALLAVAQQPPTDEGLLEPPAEQPSVVDPVSQRLELIYTGGIRGVGRSRSHLDTLQPLVDWTSASGAVLSDLRTVHGVLAQGSHLLRVDDTMAGAVAFLKDLPVQCEPASGAVSIRTLSGRLIVESPTLPEGLEGSIDEALQRRQCRNASGLQATLTTRGEDAVPTWSLGAWEAQDAVRGTAHLGDTPIPFLAVPETMHDFSRTVQAIQEAREASTTTLFVDAGASLDGASSLRDGSPSMHRADSLRQLERLQPAALVPGDTELVGGARAFFEEVGSLNLPYIATNWDSTDPLLELPPTQVVSVELPSGPIRVAFLGILDPALAHSHVRLAHEGISITDPIEAVQPIVDELMGREAPPDAIVALTTASGDVQERIRRKLRGVDLLIGDPSMATYRTLSRKVELAPLATGEKGAALTLPLDGLARAELTFSTDRAELQSVRTTPMTRRSSDPTDPEAMADITRVRAIAYTELEAPLVSPPAGSNPLTGWSTTDWNQLLCASIRAGTGADIVLLGDLPAPPRTPGPSTELQVLRSLARYDTLQVHRIPGSQIQRLSDRLEGATPIACGLSPGSYITKLGPRWLDPDRVYRVVTTNTLDEGTTVGDILDAFESKRALDPPGSYPLMSTTHPERAATLRSVALRQLRETRTTLGGPEGVWQELAVDGPQRMDPLWLFRIRRAGLQTQSFQGVDDPSFATVPETLATSPSSYTLGSEADLALEYSGPHIWSDVRAVGMFNRVRAGEAPPEELADDLIYSTSHSLPGAAFPVVAPLQMMPFTELAYDTELTAIEVAEGGTGIKQADLSLALGISALRTGAIRSLRVSGFVNRDMARLDEKPSEYGGRLDWETYKSFGPSVRWTTTANTMVFANTGQDDASDLRLRALGDTRLLLPLATWLELGAYGQVFAIRGRTPTNDYLVASTTWGITLDMSGAFALR